MSATSYSVCGLFAGIGGFEIGLHQAGFQTSLLCEKDEIATKVLKHWKKNIHPEIKHRIFAKTTLQDDVCSLTRIPKVTLLTAGFPCQDLSLAGTKKGLEGLRSGLISHVFRLLANSKEPDWVLLENVPYMISLKNSHAMRYIVEQFEALGYNWAYRVVDVRSFGIPQRRERVLFLASKKYDPRLVLFPDIETKQTKFQDKHEEPSQSCSHTFGFYWTEGKRSLGWGVNSVPTIKVGSALNIPSPPAIWNQTRDPKLQYVIGTPQIEDLEALQGFPRKWTDCVEERYRWKLIGNAVCPAMSKWVGERIIAVMKQKKKKNIFQGKGKSFSKGKKWPKAGYGGTDGSSYSLSMGPCPLGTPKLQLLDFLQQPLKPLSYKATKGFFSRICEAEKNKKFIARKFHADVEEHLSFVNNR